MFVSGGFSSVGDSHALVEVIQGRVYSSGRLVEVGLHGVVPTDAGGILLMGINAKHDLQDGVCLVELFIEGVVPIKDAPHGLQVCGIVLLDVVGSEFMHLLQTFRVIMHHSGQLDSVESTAFFFR